MKNYRITIKIKDVEETKEYFISAYNYGDAGSELDIMFRMNTDNLLDMEIEKITIELV